MIEQRTLGNTGPSVTCVGFGAGPIGYLGTAQNQGEAMFSADTRDPRFRFGLDDFNRRWF